MQIIKFFIFSFMATFGYSILFNSPKDTVIKSSITGGIGWVVYYITTQLLENNIMGSLFGAIAVGILGELFSRYYKKPATVFIIPGIIPLVPGAGMYYTMFSLVEQDYAATASKGIETLFIALSISIGLMISTILSTSIKRTRNIK